MERGEKFAQAISPATLIYGGGRFPCKISALEFHELYQQPGGVSEVKEIKATLRRMDVNPAIVFERGQQVKIERHLRGSDPQTLDLAVADGNTSDATCIYLTLERQPA